MSRATVLACTVFAVMAMGQLVARADIQVRCDLHHSLHDDPIVFHGQPGASHLHDFYGSKATDAYSTPSTLAGTPTTCLNTLDSTGYWAPETFINGQPITAGVFQRVYYVRNGFPAPVESPPQGVELIAGDAGATGEQDKDIVNFSCGASNSFFSPERPRPYDCTPYASLGSDGIVEKINFPQCWDGQLNAEAVDDTPHFRYGLGTDKGPPCPTGFTRVVAQISERIHLKVYNPLDINGNIILTLSSGPYYTLHADYMDGWDPVELQRLVTMCLNSGPHDEQLCRFINR